MRKTLLTALLLVTGLLALSLPAQAAEVTLRLTHNAGPGQSIDLASNYLAELVAERTEGRVDLRIFPNNVLGPEPACRDMLVENSIDMIAIGFPTLSNWSNVVPLPQSLYAFKSEEELLAIMTGEFGQKYFYEPFLANQKVRILDQWPQSPRQLMSKRPVRGLADLKGLKLRTPAGIPIWEASWNRMGVMPLVLTLDEVYTAVQQGVCDAVELPLDFIAGYRIQEEAKYLTMTNHIFYTQMVMIHDNSWNKMSAEDQKILEECIKEAGAYEKKARLEAQQKILDDFKAVGVEIIELTPEAYGEFVNLVSPLVVEMQDQWGEAAAKDFADALAEIRQ